MSAKQMIAEDNVQKTDFTNSVVLQVVSALVVTGFTAFMANGWYRQLSQLPVAEEKTVQKVAIQQVSVKTEVTEVKDVPEVEVVSAITDTAVVEELQGKLYEQIDQNWRTNPSFYESLVYQVNVKEDGEIASYTSINKTETDYINETPLPTLTEPTNSIISSQPFAQFLVVLTPRGSLEVSPWVANN